MNVGRNTTKRNIVRARRYERMNRGKEKEGRPRVERYAIAGGHGRMPRSSLSIGVGVSSSVSSGRHILSLSPSPALFLPLAAGREFIPLSRFPSRSVARPSTLPFQPSITVTGVGLAPNSYKIDGREPHRHHEGFPWRSTFPPAYIH